MGILGTAIDPRHPSYLENRGAMLQCLAELETALETARAGGGERHVTRHHARGKLLPRERIELLVDQDAPFLELSPAAAWDTPFTVGASVVTGIGVVEGVECVLVAHDPTVRGGLVNPYTLRKIQRATQIALANRLPLITLVESAGLDPAAQAETLGAPTAVLRDLARLSAARVATVSVVFGEASGAGAHLPGGSDYTIMVRNQAKVYLAGPVAVRAASGERTDDESLGGAGVHAGVTGLADFLAEDDRDALRLARQCVRRLNHRKLGPPPRDSRPAPPQHAAEDLLSVAGADPRTPFDPREVLARVLDGSELDEFKPAYGGAVVAGWAELHGYPVAVLATARPELTGDDARKITHFIQLAGAAGTPLIFLQCSGGYRAGTEQEHGGIVKHSAAVVNAVANCPVPHLSLLLGGPYRAGGYPLGGHGLDSRFVFAWPNAWATPGSRAAAVPVDSAASERAEPEPTTALAPSGRLNDDGVIDPRDTRTVLGICLSALHGNTVGAAGTAGPTTRHAEGFGIFRM